MSLCSQSDIEVLRQLDFTDDPDARVAQLISLAEGVIEGESGRKFDPVIDEVLLMEDASEIDGVIYAPHYPLTAVAVTDGAGTPYTEGDYFRWTFSGRIFRTGMGTGVMTWDWQYNVTGVGVWYPDDVVTYSGGIDNPDDAPRDLRTLCAQVAASFYDMGVTEPGIQSESVGGWSVAYGQVVDGLSTSQRRILRKYSHRLPIIAT